MAAYPLLPGWSGGRLDADLKRSLGVEVGQKLPTLFVYGLLALGLNVVVGYTGLLHLGIAAFFGIGAYATGILVAGRTRSSSPSGWC